LLVNNCLKKEDNDVEKCSILNAQRSMLSAQYTLVGVAFELDRKSIKNRILND